jgi:NAD(P)-dependent dehydrogenase (short-subunit alcohol dehydrogenase family)
MQTTTKNGKSPKIQLKPITDQVAVIFGASSGMGRGTALALAERGAKVVLAARGEEGLRSLVSEIQQTGGEAIYVVADASEYNQVAAVAEQAVQTFGRIDTWAHFAAVSIYATFEETTPEEFDRVIHVNLLGQIYGAKVALPHLRRAGGGALSTFPRSKARWSCPIRAPTPRQSMA